MMIDKITQFREFYRRRGTGLVGHFIPLFPRSKKPYSKGWRTPKQGVDIKHVEAWLANDRNVGLALGQSLLVVDIDPRNFKENINAEAYLDEIAKFLKFRDFAFLLSGTLSVRTGGDGHHLYFTLTEEQQRTATMETTRPLSGVEFKRSGRYVLAPGSVHPNGNLYVLNRGRVGPAPFPDKAFKYLKREAGDTERSQVPGVLTGQQLWDLVLSKLSVLDYRSHDDWFPLMCGCHHATEGEGVEEFVKWCLGDPKYAGQEGEIRKRWESLYE